MVSPASLARRLRAPLVCLLLAAGLSACERADRPEASDAEKAAALAGARPADPEGDAQQAAADENPARELLDKLKASGTAEEAATLEEDIWDAWLVSGSATVDLLMSRGLEALEADEAELAREMFDRAVAIRPDYSEAWNRRALLFFNDGKYDEAIADLEAALSAEPRHFGAWIGLGMIFESSGEPAAALLAYRKALEVHPFAEAAKQGESRLIPQVEGRAL
jgi:tetratricopeptide (TPR) repeat protein